MDRSVRVVRLGKPRRAADVVTSSRIAAAGLIDVYGRGTDGAVWQRIMAMRASWYGWNYQADRFYRYRTGGRRMAILSGSNFVNREGVFVVGTTARCVETWTAASGWTQPGQISAGSSPRHRQPQT